MGSIAPLKASREEELIILSGSTLLRLPHECHLVAVVASADVALPTSSGASRPVAWSTGRTAAHCKRFPPDEPISVGPTDNLAVQRGRRGVVFHRSVRCSASDTDTHAASTRSHAERHGKRGRVTLKSGTRLSL